jgi:hypothetical protein
MIRTCCVSLVLAASLPAPRASAQNASLNDTGQRESYTANSLSPVPDPPDFPGQDSRYGRDVAAAESALLKQGRGAAGFDFSKLGSDGQPLAVQDQSWARSAQGFDAGSEAAGTRWACVRDHATGLDWEIKTRTALPDLHDRAWTYSWFSSAARPDGTANANNGGEAGGVNRGQCFDKFDELSNPFGLLCDSAGYVAAVNAVALCGFSDWRMPTRRELESIIHFGTRWPAIDTALFPNVSGDFGNPQNPTPNVTWSGTPAPFSDSAWSVYYEFGAQIENSKTFATSLRLVRSAP